MSVNNKLNKVAEDFSIQYVNKSGGEAAQAGVLKGYAERDRDLYRMMFSDEIPTEDPVALALKAYTRGHADGREAADDVIAKLTAFVSKVKGTPLAAEAQELADSIINYTSAD